MRDVTFDVTSFIIIGAGRGRAATLPRQLRVGGRQGVRRVGLQERTVVEPIDVGRDSRRRRATVLRECRVAAIAAATTRKRGCAVSRASRARFLPATLSCAIRAPLLPHVASVRGVGVGAGAPSAPRGRPGRVAANHVRTIRTRFDDGEASVPCR